MAYPPGRELNLGYVFFGNGHAKEFLPLIHDDIHSSIGHRQIFPPECSSTLASCGWRWPCQVSWRLFPAHYGGGWLRWLKSVYAGHTSTSEAELKVAQPSRSEPLLQLRWLASQRETLILSYPDQISQIRHGKSTISQPALIVSDPVQISQIRDRKFPQPASHDRVWSCPDFPYLLRKITLSQPALIVSDPVQVSQICDGKSNLSRPALIVSDPVQISQIHYGKSITSLHANMPTCRHDNMPTCQHANMPTCRHANMPTCQHADMPELNMSDLVWTEHVWSWSGWENSWHRRRRRTKHNSMGLDVNP